ncbi:hypothetical protein P5V15_015796 [Pogonomyrmex californicus]
MQTDEKLKATHAYFIRPTSNLFLECEDCYNEVAYYIAEKSCWLVKNRTHSIQRRSIFLQWSFDKWESFRDRFKSMIYNDPSLSNVERMHYLCSCVKGDAILMWNILVSHYDNKRRLIMFHLQTLLNCRRLSESSRIF